MRISEIYFTLKDRRTALLRSPEERDAEEMLEYLRKTSGETEYLLRYPEECGRYTLEGEKALFEQKNASPFEAMIVCEVEGRIAGNCAITFGSRIKARHKASVAIALLKDYWSLGIGTRMFEEMIRMAEEREGILQMELEFIEGNARARALYEKMGFRITGIHPDAVMLKDGTLLNEYLMTRKIRRQR